MHDQVSQRSQAIKPPVKPVHAVVRPRERPCNQTIRGTTGTCGAAPARSRQRAAGRQAPAAAPLPSAQVLDCSLQARECVAATTAATAGPVCKVMWRSGHCRRLLQPPRPLPPAMRPAQWQAGRLASEAASGCKGHEAGVLVRSGCLCAYCRTVAVEAAVVPTRRPQARPSPVREEADLALALEAFAAQLRVVPARHE